MNWNQFFQRFSVKRLAANVIVLYQHTLSPDHSWTRMWYPHGACKYHPTCSEYTKQAILQYGFWRGIWLGGKRILRCHPWAQGGHDPLPDHL